MRNLCLDADRYQNLGMLTCFVTSRITSNALCIGNAISNCATLIEAWEARYLPVVFIKCGSDWLPDNASKSMFQPRPGDLILQPDNTSVLRDHTFRELYSDLGSPPLFLAGSDQRGMIFTTTIDCLLTGRAPVIITDATYSTIFNGDLKHLAAATRRFFSHSPTTLTTSEIVSECMLFDKVS